MLNEDINNAGQQVLDRMLDRSAGQHSGRNCGQYADACSASAELPCLRLISLPNESMQLTVDELKQNAIYCQSYSGKGVEDVSRRYSS